jgi:predicted ArsR family transcriptional regulator
VPQKNTPRTSPAKRKEIALAKVRGAGNKEIAEELGISPKTVEKHLADPRTRVWMQVFTERHESKLDKAFAKAIETLTLLMDHSDAQTRLAAVDRLMAMLTAIDRSSGAGEGQQDAAVTFTLAELHMSLQKYVSTASPVRGVE